MVERGATIIIDGEASVRHEHHETVRESWRRGRREALGQSAWRGAKPYSLAAVARLGAMQALGHLRRSQWDSTRLAGAFAYYHGRYTGFAEARRQSAVASPRLLPRPRQFHKLACGEVS